MIIDFNRYNGGGGSGSGVTPEQVQQQIDSAITPYWDSAETQDAISAATSGKADKPIRQTYPLAVSTLHINSGNYDLVLNGDYGQNIGEIWAPRSNGQAGQILVAQGGQSSPVWSAVTMGGNSNILPAITTQAEYEAISGDVKTGDLIQVWDVDINGDNNPEYGLFAAADVNEEEYEGVIRKEITWGRMDNSDSVTYSSDYPWMGDNGVNPIELGVDTFIISPDATAEDEAYNGIGFDYDGKPVITHFSPEYDEETGEIDGITREDANIVKSTSVSTIWKGTQAEYDAIPTKDPSTFYIIL